MHVYNSFSLLVNNESLIKTQNQPKAKYTRNKTRNKKIYKFIK